MKEQEQSFVRRASGSPIQARDGAIIFELLRPETSAITQMSIASGELSPGQKARAHFHKLSEEAYYILSGEGNVYIGERVAPIQTGDAIHIPVQAIHALENSDQENPLRVLAISSPPYTDDDIFFSD